MYADGDEIYIETMTADITAAVERLAIEVEKNVPDTGWFSKVTIPFKDNSKGLDITDWQLAICSISKADGGNENKRYLEVSGLLKSGYKISSFNFCGTKSECIERLRDPSYVERIKVTIRVNLNAMDD